MNHSPGQTTPTDTDVLSLITTDEDDMFYNLVTLLLRCNSESFVVSPHANDLDRFPFFIDLIDNAVLDINSSGIGTGKITDQYFKGGRSLKRVTLKNLQ